MSDEDKELFESAQPRDDHGRFAPKAEAQVEPEPPVQSEPEPAPPPEPEPQAPVREPEPGIPPWRLKEEADARRAAEARAAEFERQMAQIQQQQQQNKQPVPDIFENPSGFVGHEVRTAIDPVKSEIMSLREFYSRRDADRQYGAEKVQAAYDALAQASKAGNPEAVAIVHRVANSMDPFGEIVTWHLKQTVYGQIGPDPNAWFEKQLEERAKDPAFQAKLLERIRGQASQRPVTQLPPSLNKTASAAPIDDSGEDNSDGGLLKSALRR